MHPTHLRLRRSTRGSALVILTLFVVVLFAFAALSLDVGNVLREQRKAQLATDAAALGAVMLLSNQTQSASAVINAATALAGANGVTTTEIAASIFGSIQVGVWSNNQFSTTLPSGARYNAVQVPARRTVPMMFARVVGMQTMRPAVRSVATLSSLYEATGLRPFGITSNWLSGATNNVVIVGKQGPQGQWGQLEFNNEKWPSDRGEGSWYYYMMQGYPGAVQVFQGAQVPTSTGSDQAKFAFDDLKATGETIVIPVVDTFNVNGSGPVKIVDFIGVQVINRVGNGNNLQLTLRIVPGVIWTGTGGNTNSSPYTAQVRGMVQ